MARALIVIPTYNERGNVLSLVPEIFQNIKDANILIVDDSSPDDTAGAVKDMQRTYPNLHLLVREKKEGLGRAYVAGFEWGLKNNYEVLVEMDADFSHRVIDLHAMFQVLTQDIDFVVGSRWMTGGEVKNWDKFRYLLSRLGNYYAAFVLGGAINDWTGGFNIWRAEILRRIDMPTLESQGYSFQIEMKYRALRLNFRGIEVPIIFEERRLGYSKMSFSIIFEAVVQVWRLKSKF
ncbi:MAG: polyprenol monophosphomannose synthase [Bdellovibrionales bacterium]|nr:polyprenol monophosphomannose synthase [Bdellovibrionales bacterium]